jgi:hypothetical protein
MGVKVFDFGCANGHVVERFVNDDIHEHQCECGAMGKRQIAAPRAQLEGITGAFPGAAMAWEKRRESHMAKERKNQENHGTYK